MLTLKLELSEDSYRIVQLACADSLGTQELAEGLPTFYGEPATIKIGASIFLAMVADPNDKSQWKIFHVNLYRSVVARWDATFIVQVVAKHKIVQAPPWDKKHRKRAKQEPDLRRPGKSLDVGSTEPKLDAEPQKFIDKRRRK